MKIVRYYDIDKRLEQVVISPQLTIEETIPYLDKAGLGVLLLCDSNRKLVGVVTDGDIRRAFLNQVSFQRPCIEIASLNPLTISGAVFSGKALQQMDSGKPFAVGHLPVLNIQGEVIDLLLRCDLVSEESPDMTAIVMAGGYGTRLKPLTDSIPKPMLPVGDKPLLELIIDQLRCSGIQQVSIATHYLPDRIKNYFGDGKEFGIDVSYIDENQPLGTAGALRLIDSVICPILVINGDILTKVDFRAMLKFHNSLNAHLTVGVRKIDIKIPFGVVSSNDQFITNIEEKPVIGILANAGIYLVEPAILHLIPRQRRYDMTDLIRLSIKRERNVVSFPIVEYWIDVGQPKDYQKAQADVMRGRL
jgi:dTDP-glucose pyrophosphorylase